MKTTFRILSLVFGLVLALHAQAGTQFESKCLTELPSPRVRVLIKAVPPAIPAKASIGALAQRAARGVSAVQESGVVFGLTTPHLSLDREYHLARLIERSTGEACGSADITVTLGFHELQVLIADVLPEGSCEERLVREHEAEHVAANMAHLKALQARMTTQLQLELGTGRLRGRTDAELIAATSAKADQILRTVLQAEDAKLTEVHSRIDSAEAMAQVKTACGGALVALAQQIRPR